MSAASYEWSVTTTRYRQARPKVRSKAEVPREACRWGGSIGYLGGSVRSLSAMSCCEFVVVLVGGWVEAFVLACEVVSPIGVAAAVVDESAELEDGFAAVQAPAAAGDVEAVADQVAAGALDRAGWRSASPR